jgi:hypothetical protein
LKTATFSSDRVAGREELIKVVRIKLRFEDNSKMLHTVPQGAHGRIEQERANRTERRVAIEAGEQGLEPTFGHYGIVIQE